MMKLINDKVKENEKKIAINEYGLFLYMDERKKKYDLFL